MTSNYVWFKGNSIKAYSFKSSGFQCNLTTALQENSLHLVTNEASVAEIMSTVVNVLKVLKTTLQTEAQNIDWKAKRSKKN